VVHNHYGPGDDPMWCFDGACTGDDGGVYYYPASDATPWGPRPDFAVPEVRAFIADNARMWSDDYHVDGLRWDATNAMRAIRTAPNPDGTSLLRELAESAAGRPTPAWFVAEDAAAVGQEDPSLTVPAERGGVGFPSQWGFSFAAALDHALLDGTAPSDKPAILAAAFNALAAVPLTSRIVFAETHDTAAAGRYPNQAVPTDPTGLEARRRTLLATTLVFTAPGVPMLFQGQEFFSTGAWDEHAGLDWSRAASESGMVAFHRALLRLRRDLDGASGGLRGAGVAVEARDASDHVFAFTRSGSRSPAGDVVVVANLEDSDRTIDVKFPGEGEWHVALDTESRAWSAALTHTSAAPIAATGGRGAVSVGPFGAVVVTR
jgi:1,4-alpha-glucan branching enzyme